MGGETLSRGKRIDAVEVSDTIYDNPELLEKE